MEVGCLRHPGASTIGSQLLAGDCSHGWQILETQPPCSLKKKSGKGVGENFLEETRMQERMPQSKCMWNSDICACVETADYKGMQMFFVVSSIKSNLI